MKTIIKFGFVLMLSAMAMIGMTGSANADFYAVHSAGICQAFDGDYESDIRKELGGTVNENAGDDKMVTCPIVRRTQNTNGAKVFVEGWSLGANAGDKIPCTLWSVDWDGTVLGSVSGNLNGAGVGFITLNLSGAGKSSQWSHYNVICDLPMDEDGKITNIAIHEFN
ncbi:MAG: hypothetical protein ACU84H_00800 [Gammaproteobacteria bacterium]